MSAELSGPPGREAQVLSGRVQRPPQALPVPGHWLSPSVTLTSSRQQVLETSQHPGPWTRRCLLVPGEAEVWQRTNARVTGTIWSRTAAAFPVPAPRVPRRQSRPLSGAPRRARPSQAGRVRRGEEPPCSPRGDVGARRQMAEVWGSWWAAGRREPGWAHWAPAPPSRHQLTPGGPGGWRVRGLASAGGGAGDGLPWASSPRRPHGEHSRLHSQHRAQRGA
ncbi:uncharacterized protein LOC119865578 isoform X1 [Canis lupus familiaris]|uniref:uncharacterized protein LOC119865578 isoform X1 n=1 Tax=Canis lupus familiaris TaxID=9615 RepID=UPI0018F7DC96|nr:uncharacterized protein LOC119865578 isoform X1 [Canis lupus familiaris]